MKSIVYEAPVEVVHDLITKITTLPGYVCDILDQCPPIRNGVTSGQAFSLRADLTSETRHRPLREHGS